MSMKNGTAAETERKKMLEEQGHIVLNLGQNQYGDLEDVCCNIIIEVKSSKNSRRDLSKREKEQMDHLLNLRKWRTIRYDVRFHGHGSQKPSWEEFLPSKPQSSFKSSTNKTKSKEEAPQIVSKLSKNKNKGGKR